MCSSDLRISAFGLGTWHMGERADARRAEVEALRTGIDLGLNVIDTAEMYASGGAEEVVAEAVRGRRDDVFIVSKVMPQNASRKGTIAACEKSLKRLSTDRIDLYLLHWRGSHPLAETVAALASLRQAGKIRHWGVSNFDVADMEELDAIDGGKAFRFKLRPGVKFWDGSPMTADDVKFSLDRLVNLKDQPATYAANMGAVTIVDPRSAFATAARFPGVSLSHEWPDEALKAFAPDRRTAIVTLTHDPKLDDPALAAALKSAAFYIGALGSRKTHAARLARLKEQGFSDADVARIHGPVGLAIGDRKSTRLNSSHT